MSTLIYYHYFARKAHRGVVWAEFLDISSRTVMATFTAGCQADVKMGIFLLPTDVTFISSKHSEHAPISKHMSHYLPHHYNMN